MRAFLLSFSMLALACSGNHDSDDTGEAPDNIAPAAPTDLKATVSRGVVTLSWTPSADHDASAHSVYRDGEWLKSPDADEWSDGFAVLWSTHRYTVVAKDDWGNVSEPSAPLEVEVTLAPEEMAGSWTGELDYVVDSSPKDGWFDVVVDPEGSVTGTIVLPLRVDGKYGGSCGSTVSTNLSGLVLGDTFELVIEPRNGDSGGKLDSGSLSLPIVAWDEVTGAFQVDGTSSGMDSSNCDNELYEGGTAWARRTA